MSTTQERPPIEEFLPNWVEDDAQVDYCYGTCGCGWRSKNKPHPDDVEYQLDVHHDSSRTPDCTLGTTHFIFEDGSEVSFP